MFTNNEQRYNVNKIFAEKDLKTENKKEKLSSLFKNNSNM